MTDHHFVFPEPINNTDALMDACRVAFVSNMTEIRGRVARGEPHGQVMKLYFRELFACARPIRDATLIATTAGFLAGGFPELTNEDGSPYRRRSS